MPSGCRMDLRESWDCPMLGWIICSGQPCNDLIKCLGPWDEAHGASIICAICFRINVLLLYRTILSTFMVIDSPDALKTCWDDAYEVCLTKERNCHNGPMNCALEVKDYGECSRMQPFRIAGSISSINRLELFNWMIGTSKYGGFKVTTILKQ